MSTTRHHLRPRPRVDRDAIRETQQLLDQHGTTITPAPNPSDALINRLATTKTI